jgi:hypothetical protein
MGEIQETTGDVFIIANLIVVDDNPRNNFISLEVFPDQVEADYALTLMLLRDLEPENFRQNRIEFEGQLPEVLATSPVRVFVTRWDLPGHPGEAELMDHLDHLGVAPSTVGQSAV